MSTIRQRNWLLLLFDGEGPIDRIRIQKAMFLFAQRSRLKADEKYSFEPYHYGPFSFAIYPDLERLIGEGLIRGEEVPWLSSPVYSLTANGRAKVQELIAGSSAPDVKLLREMRDFVMTRTFDSLLREIYALYPKYAARSVFRRV